MPIGTVNLIYDFFFLILEVKVQKILSSSPSSAIMEPVFVDFSFIVRCNWTFPWPDFSKLSAVLGRCTTILVFLRWLITKSDHLMRRIWRRYIFIEKHLLLQGNGVGDFPCFRLIQKHRFHIMSKIHSFEELQMLMSWLKAKRLIFSV
jgi:hypothetical protein